MCTCDYRTYWHLLVRLRKYELLVQWSLLWNVADACFVRDHWSCKGADTIAYSLIHTCTGNNAMLARMIKRSICSNMPSYALPTVICLSQRYNSGKTKNFVFAYSRDKLWLSPVLITKRSCNLLMRPYRLTPCWDCGGSFAIRYIKLPTLNFV